MASSHLTRTNKLMQCSQDLLKWCQEWETIPAPDSGCRPLLCPTTTSGRNAGDFPNPHLRSMYLVVSVKDLSVGTQHPWLCCVFSGPVVLLRPVSLPTSCGNHWIKVWIKQTSKKIRVLRRKLGSMCVVRQVVGLPCQICFKSHRYSCSTVVNCSENTTCKPYYVFSTTVCVKCKPEKSAYFHVLQHQVDHMLSKCSSLLTC